MPLWWPGRGCGILQCPQPTCSPCCWLLQDQRGLQSQLLLCKSQGVTEGGARLLPKSPEPPNALPTHLPQCPGRRGRGGSAGIRCWPWLAPGSASPLSCSQNGGCGCTPIPPHPQYPHMDPPYRYTVLMVEGNSSCSPSKKRSTSWWMLGFSRRCGNQQGQDWGVLALPWGHRAWAPHYRTPLPW